jgi:hypothetical protein
MNKYAEIMRKQGLKVPTSEEMKEHHRQKNIKWGNSSPVTPDFDDLMKKHGPEELAEGYVFPQEEIGNDATVEEQARIFREMRMKRLAEQKKNGEYLTEQQWKQRYKK